MDDSYITLTIGKTKNIALIAHDNKKPDLIAWCEENKEILKNHSRVGLIGDNTKGHVLEIKGLSLDDFTLYDYLRVKDKYIYWFDK